MTFTICPLSSVSPVLLHLAFKKYRSLREGGRRRAYVAASKHDCFRGCLSRWPKQRRLQLVIRRQRVSVYNRTAKQKIFIWPVTNYRSVKRLFLWRFHPFLFKITQKVNNIIRIALSPYVWAYLHSCSWRQGHAVLKTSAHNHTGSIRRSVFVSLFAHLLPCPIVQTGLLWFRRIVESVFVSFSGGTPACPIFTVCEIAVLWSP